MPSYFSKPITWGENNLEDFYEQVFKNNHSRHIVDVDDTFMKNER